MQQMLVKKNCQIYACVNRESLSAEACKYPILTLLTATWSPEQDFILTAGYLALFAAPLE